MNELPLFCERCGAEPEPGKAEFYVVRIEAFADPTPPSVTAEDLKRDIAAEIERLLASMRDLPPGPTDTGNAHAVRSRGYAMRAQTAARDSRPR